jgi:hypothetical protein
MRLSPWWWMMSVEQSVAGETEVPLCPPQIPHNLTWVRTRAAAVGSRRLTARPLGSTLYKGLISGALTAAKTDKIFSGYQPCQLFQNYRRFRNHPCPHQTLMVGDRDGPWNVGNIKPTGTTDSSRRFYLHEESHLPFGTDGVHLPFGQLSDGAASPQLTAHGTVARYHGRHWCHVRRQQQDQVVPVSTYMLSARTEERIGAPSK